MGLGLWGLGSPTLNLLVGYHSELKVNLFDYIYIYIYRDSTTPKRLKVTYSTTRQRKGGTSLTTDSPRLRVGRPFLRCGAQSRRVFRGVL